MPNAEAHEYHAEDKDSLELRHQKSPIDYLRKVKVGRRVAIITIDHLANEKLTTVNRGGYNGSVLSCGIPSFGHRR